MPVYVQCKGKGKGGKVDLQSPTSSWASLDIAGSVISWYGPKQRHTIFTWSIIVKKGPVVERADASNSICQNVFSFMITSKLIECNF